MENAEYAATVVGAHRIRADWTVIRLIGEFVPFAAGQSVQVRVPQHPNMVRRLYPALPPSLDGKLEFHVRTVPGGWCSPAIVTDTRPGDQWQISAPEGWLAVAPDATDVVLLAEGPGLAPMRSLILDLARRAAPPRTHLLVGARHPRDLYASDMLYLLAGELPWLTVIPVVHSEDEPDWVDQWYEASRVDIGFQPQEMLPGTLADAINRFGPLDHHQILVCGNAAPVQLAVDSLIANGAPTEAIRYEGF
ncbi:oxidoreductase [Nocardia uniformis]|uniref:Oxidoreductase n=1 Tax=Nocardia uniformis TaxID=53432 RepID=A0A849CCJ9_9NOCA|nr:oxidoreductase [Nocardia uniformis]